MSYILSFDKNNNPIFRKCKGKIKKAKKSKNKRNMIKKSRSINYKTK
jgi:hypothetical protein